LLHQPGFVILLLAKPYQKLGSTESACGDDVLTFSAQVRQWRQRAEGTPNKNQS
jgi:hypothetical protein